MQASLEISMYPLKEDYKESIQDFIDRVKSYEGLTVKVNTMSTQVFGDYEEVMFVVTKEIKTSFMMDPTTIMVMKLINTNLKE